ncbi:hypothetical protein [Streptomyces sp. NPDC048361]|uniref:hypothetical protein n=1 Tax=Streptomyces sp. NPDC048361 TaxID=3154720 RepID=UPI003445864D
MTSDPTPRDPAWEGKRRRAGILAFAVGAAATLAFFAFFPGLPHVVDWGAVLLALLVGATARWAWQAHVTKKHGGAG